MYYVDCKSPLNYMGGKYKLIPQIMELLPEKVDTFIDLFGGGFNVGVAAVVGKVIYNDTCKQAQELLQTFAAVDTDDVDKAIKAVLEKYDLSVASEDKTDNYYRLRNDYNTEVAKGVFAWDKLFALIACSFNNLMRFNNSGAFNAPYGVRTYNVKLRENLIRFVNRLHNSAIKYTFTNKNFIDYISFDFKVGTFVYCDPPYLNSKASYNKDWSEQQELLLRSFLDTLTVKHVKWALSNDISCNKSLVDWAEKRGYTIHELSADYANCYYTRKENIHRKTQEVLITNY